jgi:tetratricopeptide (TPR) repeat protein
MNHTIMGWIKSRLGNAGAEPAALLREANSLRERAPEQAQQIGLDILKRSPDDVQALSLLANIAADLGQVEEGLRWADKGIAADPAAAAPYYCKGRLWDLAGRLDQAEASYRKVLDLDPGHAKAHNNLGCVLTLQGRHDEALVCYRHALRLEPGLAEANQNISGMTSDAQARETAVRAYQTQIRNDPADARAHLNLAKIYSGQGRNTEAMECLERSIELDPDDAEAHYCKAMLLLLNGDYAAGWREYDWRWRLNGPLGDPARRFAQPMWDGRDLGSGALLMHGELALGEPLQFARYARLAAARCGSVIIECAPRVKTLLQGIEGVGQAVAAGEALPPFAAHIPLYGLPHLFGTTLQNIHWNGPYIHPDPRRVDRWRSLIEAAGKARFRVGLAWSGNRQIPYNADRSIELSSLTALLSIPGAAFYSLQKDGAADIASLRPAPGNLIDLTAHEHDLLDTAAFISQLDLVITVDTMISALAGAMGARVWVLLCHAPDWRHHLERSDNPWYPTMRLYRQGREGEWAEVVERVAVDLRELVSGSR